VKLAECLVSVRDFDNKSYQSEQRFVDDLEIENRANDQELDRLGLQRMEWEKGIGVEQDQEEQ
jgi:hypothetical protein